MYLYIGERLRAFSGGPRPLLPWRGSPSRILLGRTAELEIDEDGRGTTCTSFCPVCCSGLLRAAAIKILARPGTFEIAKGSYEHFKRRVE